MRFLYISLVVLYLQQRKPLPMKRILTIIAAAVLLQSCEKDSTTQYSGTYNSKVLEVSPVKLYTSKGEVTDAAIVSSFVKRYQRTASLFSSDGNQKAEGRLKVDFLAGNSAQVTEAQGYEARSVIVKGSDIYLQAYTPSVRMNTEEESFFDKLVVYAPLSAVTTMVPFTTGFTSKTEFKHCLYANKSGDAIRFPMLSYLYVSVGANKLVIKMREMQQFNNLLVSDASKKLNDGDTLAVQQSYLVLNRQ